jgi:hypothetical protein
LNKFVTKCKIKIHLGGPINCFLRKIALKESGGRFSSLNSEDIKEMAWQIGQQRMDRQQSYSVDLTAAIRKRIDELRGATHLLAPVNVPDPIRGENPKDHWVLLEFDSNLLKLTFYNL